MADRTTKGDMQEAMLASTLTESLDAPGGLNDLQQRIIRYRTRGLTQKAIAQIEGITQGRVSQILREIREVFKKHGEGIDQAVVVGETMNLYQEVEMRAWEIYSKSSGGDNASPKDATKALQLVMSAREKSLKLMMDLGLIKRAAIEHKMEIAPFLKGWEDVPKEERQSVAYKLIETKLTPLEAPTPPEAYEYTDYEEVGED